MKIHTFVGVPRAEVLAILNNDRRYVIADASDETEAGDTVRLVSDEDDVNKRVDCVRVVTDQTFREGVGNLLSLRPLHKAEKESLKTEGSSL